LILVVASEANVGEEVEKAAQTEGTDCLILCEEAPIQAALQETTPEAIFIDLSTFTLDAPAIIQDLKGNTATRKIPIVAFANQIRADLLQDAKEAGADLILPRSAFNQQLPELIRHYRKHS